VAALLAAALVGAPSSAADPPIEGSQQGGVQVQTHVPVANAVAGARFTLRRLRALPASWRRIFGVF
jgi:hypothetical protein